MSARESQEVLVFLRSNDCMTTFENNKISEFENQLESPASFPIETVVGLRSIGYHKTWGNIRERNGVSLAVHFQFKKEAEEEEEEQEEGSDNKDGDNLKESTGYFNLPQGNYTSVEDIFQSIFLLAPPVDYLKLEDCVNIYFNDKTRKYSVALKKKYKKKIHRIEIMVLDTSRSSASSSVRILISMLGLEFTNDKQLVNPTRTGDSELTVVAKIEITPEKKFSSPSRSDFSNDYSTFCISTPGLVNSVMVGTSSLPILHMVPVAGRGKYGDYIHYELPNVNYHRCARTRIETIRVRVTDLDGELINFLDFSGPLVLSLQFRNFNALNLELPALMTSFRAYEQCLTYVFSNKSINDYDHNRPWSFETDLVYPLSIKGDWEVALCEVRYKRPAPILNVIGRVVITVSGLTGGEPPYSFFGVLPSGEYLSPEYLVNEWNENPVKINKWKGKLGDICRLGFLKPCGKFFISLGDSCSDLGISKVNIDFAPARERTFAFFTGFCVSEDERTDVTVSNKEKIYLFQAQPDFQQHTFNLWITAPNIVRYTRVGGRGMDLLDVLPVQGDFGSVQHYVYSHRHYKPLSTSDTVIRSLRLCMKNSAGEDAPLDPRTEVMMLLHFRKAIGEK